MANRVSGKPLLLDANSNAEIVFGGSVRDANRGRYVFTPIGDAAIVDDTIVSGVQVNAVQPTNLLMRVANIDSFNPMASSIASQIDRDIALVIDRSISMTFYNGTEPLRGTLNALRDLSLIHI